MGLLDFFIDSGFVCRMIVYAGGYLPQKWKKEMVMAFFGDSR